MASQRAMAGSGENLDLRLVFGDPRRLELRGNVVGILKLVPIGEEKFIKAPAVQRVASAQLMCFTIRRCHRGR